MSISETFGKIKKLLNGHSQRTYERVTPEERELMSYKKMEYYDNVKKELNIYRQRNRLLDGKDWKNELKIKGTPSLLSNKPHYNKKQQSLINGRGII